MKKEKYLSVIEGKEIDRKKTEEIRKLYSAEIPTILKKIVSNCDEPIFFDDGSRILSYKEILNAEKALHVPFKEKRLIPVVDCCDNIFIVFDFINNKWSMFNIVDEIQFDQSSSINDLLQ